MRPTSEDLLRAARMLRRSILKAIRLRGGLTLQVFKGYHSLNRLDD